MLGLPVKSSTYVILKGKLGEPSEYFARFLSTIKYTGDFFVFNFDPEKAYKSYAYVTKCHYLASKTFHRPSNKRIQPAVGNLFLEDWKKELCIAVQKDLKHIDTSSLPKNMLSWKPSLAVSQLDMVIVQLISIWLYWALPKLFGIKDREQELKGVIHLWAIHGRMLGIQDEYNICIKPDPKLYDLLIRNFLIESLKTMDETVITVQHTLMEAMRVRIPFMTYKAMLYIGLRELQGQEGKHLWKIMSFRDKASYRFLQGWMWLARQSFLIRILLDIPTGMWLMYHFRSDVASAFYRYSPWLRNYILEKISSVVMIFRGIFSQPK